MASTAGLTIVAALSGLVAGGFVVWGARTGRLGRAAGAVLAIAAIGAVGTLVWLVTQPLVAFHLVHLAYLVGVVTVPLIAVGCLVGAVLADEVVRIELDQATLALGGVRLDRSAPSAGAVLDDLSAAPADEVAVLLAHRPDPVLDLLPDSRVDLTVAGRTHGGQIALPVIGPVTVLSAVGREVGAGGLHDVAGNPIYVSTGIGLERGGAPQVRFLTRPSYGIVDLVPAGP